MADKQKLIDARAATLRARVEELAKASFKDTATMEERCGAASSGAVHVPLPQLPPVTPGGAASGESLPMLITSTEMGVYIKWALLLQEELERSRGLHRQLQDVHHKLLNDNKALHEALGSSPASSGRTPDTASPPLEPTTAPLRPVPMAGPSGNVAATLPMPKMAIQHAEPQVAHANGKRPLSTMMMGSRLSHSDAPLPIEHDASLSDLVLPDTPELTASLNSHTLDAASKVARVATGMTPNSRLMANAEEERMLETLLSSPSVNPAFLTTPNLAQLTSALDRRAGARSYVAADCWGSTDRAGISLVSSSLAVPSK